MNPLICIENCETGETETREMTDEEVATLPIDDPAA